MIMTGSVASDYTGVDLRISLRPQTGLPPPEATSNNKLSTGMLASCMHTWTCPYKSDYFLLQI